MKTLAAVTLAIAASLTSIASARAGIYLAQGTTITQIIAGYADYDQTAIYTTGGTTPCSSYTSGLITFPSTLSSNRQQYILQVALAAYLSGKPVDVVDDVDASVSATACAHGTAIVIHN